MESELNALLSEVLRTVDENESRLARKQAIADYHEALAKMFFRMAGTAQ